VLAPSCCLFIVSLFPLSPILGLGTLVPTGTSDVSVGFWFDQISLRLKLRKDRKTIFFLLLKLEIKVCRMVTERYIYFNPFQKDVKYYFTSNLSEGLKRYVG
jgi:hypothetical protein